MACHGWRATGPARSLPGAPRERSSPIRRIMLAALVAAFLLFPATADARKVHWHHAGASVFGGVCEPSEWQGYRGDRLPVRWRSFAELEMGTALGGLPYGAKVRVLDTWTHRRLTIRKRDIGLGGSPVRGVRRAIDLYEPVLTYLLGYRSCTWTGVILWRRV